MDKSFRHNTSGRWYKGNTHIHSTASDGGKSHVEIDSMYSVAGYDFLVATDHRVASQMKQALPKSKLLWIDGIELDGQDETGSYYHVICIGKICGITKDTPFADAMRIARKENAILILAHPFWCGNTFDDATRWGFDGVEIYNHVCHWLNGKSDGLVHWNAMLQRNPDTLAFSADDAHLHAGHPGWNGGWITVNAGDLSENSITSAIRRGNYYSSCGPEFRTIELEGDKVRITTSAVQFIRVVGPGTLGQQFGSFEGRQEITELSLPIPSDWPHFYIEIEDHEGKRAWTNTMFTVDQSSRK